MTEDGSVTESDCVAACGCGICSNVGTESDMGMLVS